MLSLITPQDWDAFHPLVVHFPIALLVVAPVMVLVGLIFRTHRNGFFLSAAVLMVLGTIAAYLSISTGEAAAQLADRTPAINRVLAEHQVQAENVRKWFTVLSVLWLALMVGLHLGREKIQTWLRVSLPVVFLGFYLVGVSQLATMAHAGGRLVHTFGLRASLPDEKEPVQNALLKAQSAPQLAVVTRPQAVKR
jgi:uncharacterized membrane protein